MRVDLFAEMMADLSLSLSASVKGNRDCLRTLGGVEAARTEGVALSPLDTEGVALSPLDYSKKV